MSVQTKQETFIQSYKKEHFLKLMLTMRTALFHLSGLNRLGVVVIFGCRVPLDDVGVQSQVKKSHGLKKS